MGSPVNTARCLRRNGRVVEVELCPTTAAGPQFPVSRTFALGLLLEAATQTVYSKPGSIWPVRHALLAEEIDFDEVLSLGEIEHESDAKEQSTGRFVESAILRRYAQLEPSALDANRGRSLLRSARRPE